MFSDQVHKVPSASYVIEHQVSALKEAAFREWQTGITKLASQFEGYVGTDVYPPVEEGDKWYITVHFDTADHLAHWLQSHDRQEMVQQGRKFFRTSKLTYYKTGLERWLLKENAAPPAWKQNLAVLVGLYPTVMGLILLFETFLPFTKSLALADSMLFSNILSCSLLGWVVMPFVTWLLRFWLKPRGQASTTNTWIGALLIVLALAIMRSLFVLLPSQIN